MRGREGAYFETRQDFASGGWRRDSKGVLPLTGGVGTGVLEAETRDHIACTEGGVAKVGVLLFAGEGETETDLWSGRL